MNLSERLAAILLFAYVRCNRCQLRKHESKELPGGNMKSRLPLLDLKGSIALLTLVVGTMALAFVPGPKQQAAAPSSGYASGTDAKFVSILKRRAPTFALFGLSNASVTTDRGDYAPGDIVHITGSGFEPGETVRLEVDYKTTGLAVPFRPESQSFASGHDPWYVNADGGGNFTSDWLVEEDSLGQTLLLTADGQSSGLHADVTFTDADVGTYDQCSNDDGDGYATGDTGCRWTNGNLQSNNSTYHEGDSTVQRVWLDGLTPGSTHTLTLKYGTTKQGKHAYDYLTTWDYSENWITDADLCQDIDGNGNGAGGSCTLWGADDLFPIPVDPNPAFTTDGVGGVPVPQPAGRNFTMRNGDITAASTPTVVSGTYAGDSETAITVTFTVGNDSDACVTRQGVTTCSVAMWFGAHISLSTEWASGGATTVPGSPYHVALDQVDGASVGQRDNQMQANAIVPQIGTLTITKQTLGGFGTFGYTVSPSPSPFPGTGTFNLTTTAQANPNFTSFANVAAGTYRVTESSLPAGWTLNDLTCTGDLDNGNVINLAGGYVDIDLDNAEGQNCTFTNILPDARIVLSPLTATNAVGSAHTITATVTQNDQLASGDPGGDGTTGFGPAPDGTLVTFSLTNNAAGATFVGGVNTCTTSGGTGTCTVQINSTSAGGVDIHATTTFSVLGVSLTRATGDGLSGDGVDVHKTYVNAQIDLSPLTATNEVNSAHTITATVQQDDGIPAAGGGDGVTGFGPAPNGTLVTFSLLNNTAGAAFVGGVNTCTTTGGTCTVQINTSTAGGVDIHATTTFSVGGVSLTRSTGTGGLNSGDAHKTYVDAQIDLTPLTATNPVGQAHTITATVQQDDGIAAPGGDNVNGFGPAPNGTLVTFSLLNNTANASFVGGVSTCTTTGGSCSVQINSNQAGGVDIHATTTFSVGGLSLTRSTGSGGLNSADAHKDYVAGSLKLVKIVVNDDGGTATVTNFGITTNAGSLTFGGGVESPAHTFTYTSNTLSNLAPGTYSLHEGTLAGYTEGTWGCVGAAGTVVGNPQTGSVVIAANENVTCTITNNDNVPTLKLVKIVDNNDGGTATAADFNLHANAPMPNDGRNFSSMTATPVFHNIFAGAVYTLSEDAVAGYTAGTWSCDGGTQVGSTIQVPLGGTVTCTINNDDQPGTIIIRKITDPLNDPTSFDFDANGTDYTDFSLTGVSTGTPPPNENSQQLNAGMYSVTEINIPAGWVLTGVGSPGSAACQRTVSGAGTSVGVGDTMTATATITLDIGDTIVCTFENTLQGQTTRTQGFWATHPNIAEVAWFGGDWNGTHFPGVANVTGIGDTLICTKDVNSIEKLMGGFWARIPQTCNDGRRSSLDKARMTLLQQLLAAELNASAFGSLPIGGSAKFAQWEAAYCGTNVTAINTAKSEAAFFNESGDSGIFTPGTAAQAKIARTTADDCFWNNTTTFAPISILNVKSQTDTLIEKP